jgi:ribosomal subunit interface protein
VLSLSARVAGQGPSDGREVIVDIVVKGRNVEVPEHYRVHVGEKLAKVERYDHKIIRIDVELSHERNPRQSEHRQRVEITCASRGPVVRAEACAKDFYTALDAACAKLESRLRRAADRRRVHKGRQPLSVAEATAALAANRSDRRGGVATLPAPVRTAPAPVEDAVPELESDDDRPWRIAREKVHSAVPMTVDDALFEMELVGHDFYLFQEKESGRPSVIYRRKGYDYGLISLAS